MNSDYQYNLPTVPRSDFETMRKYVEKAYRESFRKPPSVNPAIVSQVTQDFDEMPAHMVSREDRKGKAVGLAWTGTGHIWVKAGRELPETQRTLIHELSHLRVADQAHGPKWRRVCGVATALWFHNQGVPWEEVRREVGRIVYAYRKYRQFTPQGRYNSYAEYLNKCEAEYRKIEFAARRVCGV